MIRLFLLGLLLLGIGLGMQKGWVIFDWPKVRQDLHLNFNLPFQIIGVLLLVATVGVVLLSKKELK